MRQLISGVLPPLFFTAASVWAAVNGSVAGVVKDSSGAVVPRADVKAVNVETNVTSATVADNVGAYAFLSLPVGHYRLEVTAAGFQRYEQTDVTLNTNDELRFDIVLKVGEVSQSVEVATSAVRVETANTQLGDVITGTHMESMPLNGRMFTDLLGLQAGVVPQLSPQSQGFGNFFGTTQQGNVSISGQRETSNGFIVNGSNVDNAVNNGATVVPNLDSISEFRVLTANFDAEHGNYSGGLVTVVTKSGTNEFHGSAFDYVRNTDLDARSFFDGPRLAFQQNQFGGTIGGPIRRNKVFFFADYQGTRNNIGQGTGQVPVPSPAQRNGDFSAAASSLTGTVGGSYWASLLSKELGYTVTNGEPYYTPGCTLNTNCVFPNAVIPQSAFSAPAKALMQYVPLPNVGSTYVSSANTVHTQDDLGSARIDINTDRWGTIAGYYFIDQKSILTPFGTNNTPGFPSQDGGRSQLYTLNDTKTFSPSTLNEVNLTFNRHVYHNTLPLKGFGKLSSLGFNEDQPGGIVNAAGSFEGVPAIGFNSYSIGMPGVNYNRYENMPSVADNFSKVVGKHTLKMGGKYAFNDFYEPMPLVGGNGFISFNGTETGIDFADFLIGAPTGFVQEGGFNVDNRRNYVGLYAQDSWRVKSNLTLNYGLRWDVIQPWYEKHDQASTFVLGVQSTVHPGAPAGYVFPGDTVPGYGKIPRTIAPTRYKGFAPRFGFAYAPAPSGGFLGKLLGGPDKFSIRGGIGIFYNNLEGALEIDETGLAPFDIYYPAPLPVVFASPYTNRLDGGTHQPFPYSTQNFNWSLAVPLGGYPVPPIDQKVPYTETYNLTLQRQFGTNTLLTAGYIGNQSHHLLTQIANNPGNPQLCLSLSQPSEVAPSTPTCGPFLESAVFTRPDGTKVNGTRQPYGAANFGDNILFATIANSNYNSLQLSLRHTSGRLSFQVAYTFSKSLDDSSNLQDKQPNPLNYRLSRGLSSFDVTHNFVVSYSYLLPFDQLAHNRASRLSSGWKLVGITHLATGFPIIMYEGDDHSLLGNSGGTDTPNFLGGSLSFQNPRKANVSTGIPYFNTALFTPSAIGFEGTANKAFFHGPGINNFDMSLLKDVKLAERSKLEFRFEFFNIFNHAQFNNPGGNITSGPSNFGIINSARPGRIGQIAVKLLF
jgi:hypothetical protein